MTAEIYQIRDWQSKRAIERAHKELEKEAVKILTPFVETTGYTDTSPSELNPQPMTGIFSSLTEEQKAQALSYRGPEMIPYHGAGIDGMWKDTDPA